MLFRSQRSVGLALLVRTRSDPAALLPAIREAVWSVDPNVPLGQTRSLDEIVASSVAEPRLVAGLIAALAGLAILTQTILLLPILGGLYVMETGSVILQIISFRGFKRRIFRMSPIHHHFELLGWPESTVVVRFWILAGFAMALGLGLFYADFLRIPGLVG